MGDQGSLPLGEAMRKTKTQPRPSRGGDLETASYVKGQTLPAWRSPEAYAQWLFGFLRSDLAALSPAELLAMRANAWAFVRPEIVELSWTGDELPPLNTLTAAQADLRAGLQRVVRGEWFELENGIRYGIARMGGRIIKGSYAGTFEDLFRAAAMETVQGFWSHLHECPRCHSIFLKVGKQKYCSSSCATRTHWDAFKARRPARDHHEEYVSRTKKRVGRNVRVQRRAK